MGLRRHLINAGINAAQKETAQCIAVGGGNNSSCGIHQLHVRLGHGRVLRVQDLPGNAAGVVGLQHNSHGNVLAATHVRLDADNCLEVVIMRDPQR